MIKMVENNVKFVDITPDAEKKIAYCARVSSPNQENPEYAKLLAYCIRQCHWSIFEMADMTVEITTTRAIAAQILRHKSFQHQEMSQRYTEALDYIPCQARRQDVKNRQNSIDDLTPEIQEWFLWAQQKNWYEAKNLYDIALKEGIAKECARMLLPLNTQTRMYMKGSIRSWIHYLQVRCDVATQKEHRDIADAIKVIFVEQLPVVAKALDW
jgi:thymidylate synthase (FAD)